MKNLCSSSMIFIFIILVSIEINAQNFWEETSGPEGGWVRCLAKDKNNILYAGFDAGQFGPYHLGKCLYKSDDNGINWQSLNVNANKIIESVVVDTAGVIFIRSAGSLVFKSTDNGLTWGRACPVGFADFNYVVLNVCQNNTLILGCYEGIYFSTNGGTSWSYSTSGWAYSLFIDKEDNIYAGMYHGGLYKSSDYGLNWSECDNGLYGERVLVSQMNDSIFFAGTESGIFQSTDNCNSWNLLPNSPTEITAISIGSNNEVFVGTSLNGFFLSIDQGISWVQKNFGLANWAITSMIILPSNLIVVGSYGDATYFSSNMGETWQPRHSGMRSTHVTSFIKYNEYLFAGSEYGMLYKSSDSGDSWTRIDSTYTPFCITSIVRSYKNSMFFSTYYSPYLSNSDKIKPNQKFKQQESYFTNFLNDETAKIFKSEDEGNSWKDVLNLAVNSLATYFDPVSRIDYIIASAGDRGIYLTSDDGQNWNTINNGVQGFMEDVKIDSKGVFFSASTNEIFRSTDFGNSWQTVYTGSSLVYHTTLAISSNDYVYAGLDWGEVILSTDNGDTWIDRGQNLPVNRVNAITTDSLDRVYIGNWWGQLFQSADHGEHWVDIYSGMIGGVISNLFCDNSGNIFVGPVGGSVYHGVNTTFVPPRVELAFPGPGARNQPLTPTLKWYPSLSALTYRIQVASNNSFDSLSIVYEYDLTDTVLVIDSLNENTTYYWRVACSNQYGWSLWSITLWFKTLSTTFVDDEKMNLNSFKLSQNYPNPFNPSTVISYQLPVTSSVTLKIFDVLGNDIATLVNEEKPVGEYEVEFEGTGLPSGIYFYQLKAGSFIQTKKMVLLK